MTNTITPEQLQTIGEQQDLFYQPLQDKLRSDYDFARVVSEGDFPSYLTWLNYHLDGINDLIANYKELQ